jgi:hypothetical protein
MPTLTETIAADTQTVTDAQTALDAAKAKLAADEGQAAAAAPHLTIWQEVEAAAVKYGEEAVAEFNSLAARAKALFNL